MRDERGPGAVWGQEPRHHAALAAVKRKGPTLYPAEKTMPSTKSRQLRSSPETAGGCRSVSVSMEVTSAMARLRTSTINLLLFIWEHRNQRMIPFLMNPKVMGGSTHMAKAAFRNNVMASQPLDSASLGFALFEMRDNTVFNSVMVSPEPRAVFSASKRGMFHQFALLKLMENCHPLIIK